jgi:hypothetical protein
MASASMTASEAQRIAHSGCCNFSVHPSSRMVDQSTHREFREECSPLDSYATIGKFLSVMLSTPQHESLEDAGNELLDFVLRPENWLSPSGNSAVALSQNSAYQRQVGNLKVFASVDVNENLEVFLRISFREPNLTPLKAVDYLEQFVRNTMPLRPHTEWQVAVDDNRWVHFVRRFAQEAVCA